MREQVYNQIFSDEIWANGGAHTTSYVTVREDGSDRYLESKSPTHKLQQMPGLDVPRYDLSTTKGGPAVFWEKSLGSIDSAKIQSIHFTWYSGLGWGLILNLTFMQDNAPSHRFSINGPKIG